LIFSVTTNAASAVANRFRVVFNNGSTILPVQFISIGATNNNNNIVVQWQMANEINNSFYRIERSADGRNFTSIGIMKTLSNLAGHYSWTDSKPLQGNNYYRIKSIDNTGKIIYSSIASASVKENRGLQNFVYPNPVVNRSMNIHLNNERSGAYSVQLINALGQVVFTEQLQHNSNTETEVIDLPHTILNDSYKVEIIKPDGTKITESCLVQ
jgi:hypothetical protein